MTRDPNLALPATSIRQILERLAENATGSLGCVIHVGAGSSVLDDYANIPVDRLVVIEGDPDTAAELQDNVRRQARPVDVIAKPVAAMAGTMLWYRHNLRSLNGPRNATGLTKFFPRLSLTSTVPIQAIGLGDCLASVPLSAQPEHPNLLVMDVPGQEGALLAGLDPSVLRAFDWIVLRGCGHAPDEAWSPAATGPALLEKLQFVRENRAQDDDGLWPVSLLRFDRSGYERKAQAEQLAQTQVRGLELEHRVQLLTQAQDASDNLAADRLKRINEVEEHVRQLETALAASDNLAADRLRRIDEVEEHVRQLESALADSAVRQQLLHDELIKAEGQIDLIKDLLLREHAL